MYMDSGSARVKGNLNNGTLHVEVNLICMACHLLGMNYGHGAILVLCDPCDLMWAMLEVFSIAKLA